MSIFHFSVRLELIYNLGGFGCIFEEQKTKEHIFKNKGTHPASDQVNDSGKGQNLLQNISLKV